jgi:hypothetical protein
LTRFEGDGITTYPVSLHDVAAACANVELSTGLLPPDTLFWKTWGDTFTLGVFVAARRWQVLTAQQSYHIPLPPFVFVGNGWQYAIYAVTERPKNEYSQLYHFPTPNVHADGQICPGDTPFPPCHPRMIHRAISLFLEDSRFNNHLVNHKCRAFPDDVRQLWQCLEGKRKFPLEELLPMHTTLQDLIQ